ncbi:MAG: threonine synthase, partial [Thermoproteota archaeon]
RSFGVKLKLRVVKYSKGYAIRVTDDEILNAINDLARYEGIYACPEGAATYAGLKKFVNDGILSMDDRILLMNTGSGLKYLL